MIFKLFHFLKFQFPEISLILKIIQASITKIKVQYIPQKSNTHEVRMH
jgi:hypothetical protein